MDESGGRGDARQRDHEEKADEGLGRRRLLDGVDPFCERACCACDHRQSGEAGDGQRHPARCGRRRAKGCGRCRAKAGSIP